MQTQRQCLIYTTKNKLNTNYHITKEITKIHDNISALTRITCPTEEIRSHVLLPWDVFHSKGVFLDCYCPPKHLVVLVYRVLLVPQGLVVRLERKASASQVEFKPLDTPHNC